ncbi:hypothetical protein Pst134EB_007965 [Puccinia striiformis f. sp. tritici]|nr:hypothetical protein Pst134EB_007965 [Puccinia striiformis f. sp. tritici]
MYINVDPNKQSFKESKIAAADTNFQLEAAAAKSGSKEDDLDNEGLIIKDLNLYRDKILKRYGVDCCYN